jgi:apolipoprotein N-acyltransferase
VTAHLVSFLLWALVGLAKTAALVLLLTAADTRWPDALAWLGLAFGLVAAALWWRGRSAEQA